MGRHSFRVPALPSRPGPHPAPWTPGWVGSRPHSAGAGAASAVLWEPGNRAVPVTQCVVSWECAQRSRAEVRSCCSSKRERGGRLRDLWCGCHTPQRHRKGRARSGTRDPRRRPKAGQTRVPPEPSLENLRVHVRVCARACARVGEMGEIATFKLGYFISIFINKCFLKSTSFLRDGAVCDQ